MRHNCSHFVDAGVGCEGNISETCKLLVSNAAIKNIFVCMHTHTQFTYVYCSSMHNW